MFKKYSFLFVVLFLALVAAGCATKDTLYQVSTINALLDGVYDGDTTVGELKKHGNMGIGTFNALDGEMVALDGKFYKVTGDGKVHVVENNEKTPFAAVTFLESDKFISLSKSKNFKELKSYLNTLIPTENIMYAFKIYGFFKKVKTRSVPKQKKPYPLLLEVTKKQPTFELNNIMGSLVGFRLPDYMSGINVPKYHLHFISSDKTSGGHVLDLQTGEVEITIDETHEFFLVLPKSEEFYKLDLSKKKEAELVMVESKS